ncbi:Serine/threonine-protein kinase Pkn1 [Anaerolineae bacterium]|nr:Serine/threonine-protein kinase Pkn1 [Anaerolineae bacterium]
MNRDLVCKSIISVLALTTMGLMVIILPSASAFSVGITATAPTVTAVFAATRIPTGTSNSTWTPVEHDFNGVTMVLVPAGCFQMGSTEAQIDYAVELARKDDVDAQPEWFGDEKPIHEVCFDQPFWIDQTEVTHAQFEQIRGKTDPLSFTGDSEPERGTWFEARDFCALRGARLPTEAEWEYAARGPEGFIFPWGNTFEANRLLYAGNLESRIADVGSKPGGVSWVGALDMSGSAWEWTSSLYQPYPYQATDGREADTGTRTDILRVLRGGSRYEVEDSARAANRGGGHPDAGFGSLGFRCIRSYH